MKNLSRPIIFFLKLCLGCSFVSTGSFGMFWDNFIFAAEKIDINTAPLEDLIKIVHIGKTRAEELISLRPFSSLNDLVKIKGIGKKRLEDIKKQGLAYVGSLFPPDPESRLESKTSLSLVPKIATTPTQFQASIYPTGIIINEILPSPEGADNTEEWIEIFNQNNFEVNLSNWQITDTLGKIEIYKFPEETKISSQGFLVLPRSITKITLNNDGDSLNLIWPNGKIIDQISYEKTRRGESYNRTPTSWVWNPILTPGSANIILPPKESTETKQFKEGANLEKKTKEDLTKKELTSVNKQAPKNTPSFLFSMIALSLATFSGATILILKRKLKTLLA